MSTVPFASVCDHCSRRSPEYSSWPTCRDCDDDICPTCDIAEQRTEDERNQTLCRQCWLVGEAALKNWERIAQPLDVTQKGQRHD